VTYLLAFVISGCVVVLAGMLLASRADAIAEQTGLGRVWIGSLLLAGATSLPELVTDVAAVRLGAADLAIGDLFGSSMANMLALAVVDLLYRQRGVLRKATLDHALSACLAISLGGLAGALVLLRPDAALLRVSPGSLLLFVLYLAGTRAVYRHVRREGPDGAKHPAGAPRLRRAWLEFAAGALAILVAAPAFAWSARGIAELTGLGNTFVGTTLVGVATSLPEFVASLAAVRIGAFDLAVGNLFGSNAFNMAIFFALDLAQPGSLFAVGDPAHALTAVFAMVLTALGLAAIVYRAEKRSVLVEPDSLLLLLAYLAAIVWLHAVTSASWPG
jgi:cation:H+ antiporter